LGKARIAAQQPWLKAPWVSRDTKARLLGGSRARLAVDDEEQNERAAP